MKKTSIIKALALCIILAIVSNYIVGCIQTKNYKWEPTEAEQHNEKCTSFLVSPDSKHLAYGVPGYNKEAEKITRLMICNPDGTGVQEIAAVPGHYDPEFQEILWLDNNRLACSEYDSLHYIVVSLDGTCLPDINLPTGYRIVYKRLSPDSQRVAFIGWPASTEDGIKQQGLFVVELATGEVRHLINERLRNAPAWSPDSSKLAIGNAPMYSWTHPLVIVDVETGKVSKTGVKGVGASWSPDGRFLAFTTDFVKRRGTSWLQGVPVNGQIGVFNLASKQLIHIGPPARTYDVEGTERQDGDGALNPVWSPDGQRIAYQRITSFRSDSEETWVADREGNEVRKIIDGFYPLAWSSDNQSLYILKEFEIARIDLRSLKSQTLASWEKAELPPPTPADTITIKRPGVIVTTTRIDKAYGEAFAAILSEARREYEETFGLSLSETVQLKAERDPEGELRLWTGGESHLFLTITLKEQLAPSPQSGVYSIYGMCHELGHMVMYSKMRSMVGLPQGVGEGWAHYAGSVVVDAVASRLGKNIWPELYDVAATEGIARLKKKVEGKEWSQLDETTRAAKVFYELDKKYGRKIVGRSLNRSLSERPSGKEIMPLFVKSLRELTGDANAGSWIPEEVLVPETEWDVEQRHVEDSFFADMKTIADKIGVVLCYDDGTSDGQQSMSGSGHAVLFQRPEGTWLLDRVEVFGSRYGSPEPPDKDFSIYICDEEFNPVHEFTHPYGLFQRGKDKWVKIPIEPVGIPQRFYVCLSFNPTSTRGVYVNYDDSVDRSHSRCALPYTHVDDVQGKYDWMIRVHLCKGTDQ